MTEEQKIMDDPVAPGKSDAGPGEPDQTKTRLHLSHDGLFKVTFYNRHLAESFARENLPVEITQDLDFSSMTRDEDTFVDQKLAHCYADVLYHIRYKDTPATRRSCPGSKTYFNCSGSYPVRLNLKSI